MSAYTRATAFIDWNSQLVSYADKRSSLDAALHVLNAVSRNVARSLADEFPQHRFVIDLRVYHGWHKGFEPTPNRKAISAAIASTDFSILSPKQNVIFSGDVRYGDCLLFALERRMHERLGIHLPNTLRSQHRQQPLSEKMVDTALAADLVSHAARDQDSWLLVVAEDDDFVPPIFAAEALLSGYGAEVMLLRKRHVAGPFLKLDQILRIVR